MPNEDLTATDFALPLSEAVSESYTLPSSWYTDPAVYELEKQRIFYRTWQYVAHTSMFAEPGDYVTARICDQSVFVIMGQDGALRAFYNVCRHRAHELLSAPFGNVRAAVICPYHAWSYSLDGALRGARFSAERAGFDKSKFGLRPIRLEIFVDCVFVNLDDEAESLADLVPDLEADIRARIPYLKDLKTVSLDSDAAKVLGEGEQKAGWKVVVDNFVECYHCRAAHPDFASLIRMESYEVKQGRYWSGQSASAIRHENAAYPVDPAVGFQGSAAWYLWPNTTFNVLPGDEEFAIFVVRPIDARTSNFDGHVLTTSGRRNEARADYTARVLVPEDIALCESVQRGLASFGYEQGPFMTSAKAPGEGEQGVHHFHRLVRAALS